MESGRASSKWRHPVVTGFAAATAVGLTLGAIGPFGSYLNGSLPVRLGYWVVCLWAGWLTFGVSLPILMRWAKVRGLSAWLWGSTAVAVLAIVPAVLSRMLAMKMWPVVAQVGWAEWYGQCLVISSLATIGILLVSRARSDLPPDLGPNSQSADPRDRLPPRLGRTVLCLQMEDHYVRVHTPLGSTLVLMSLSQAMAGLRCVEGVQTHRSWWVARTAIASVVEDGRKLRLRLSGGLEAPVSRARVGILREQGWLKSIDTPQEGGSGELRGP